MSDLCEKAMAYWIQTVCTEISTKEDVEKFGIRYAGSTIDPKHGTELYGAYWALRGMCRDSCGFSDFHKRMEEFFNRHCESVITAFEEIE